MPELVLKDRYRAALRTAIADVRHATKPGGEPYPFVVAFPPSGIPLEEIERQALIAAIVRAGYVQRIAAELLGITPRVLSYKLQTVCGLTLPLVPDGAGRRSRA